MKRILSQILADWRQEQAPMPILLRGARQVGKTYIIEQLGRQHFENYLTINFELAPEYKRCFNSLKPHEITQQLSAISHQEITPGKTLLFFDEIQECPEAIQSLRYFKELMPNLHVIGAGSLLEFVLNSQSFRMPVGRVQYLYLRPMSFAEFLMASNDNALLEYIQKAQITVPIPTAIHEQLIKKLRLYTVLGGMPAVIQDYLERQDLSKCRVIQANILNTYRNDFGKYATATTNI